MQRLARRVFQRRALSVFRDESGLSTNPHLWDSILSAIDRSEWFVLLASPESAASHWVGREVATWLERKPTDRLLVVVTDGELEFSADGRVDRSATTCLPEPLVEALDSEPRWLDLRWARNEDQLDLRNGRFRAAVADLAAPVHGIPKEDLEGEDVRQQRRARRMATSAVALVGLLAIVSAVAAVIAVNRSDEARQQRNVAQAQSAEAKTQRNEAQKQRDAAEAEQTIAEAKSLASSAVATASTDVDLSLLLGIEGQRRSDSVDTETGLLAALNGARHNIGFVHGLPGDIADIAVKSDRSELYILTASGALQGWNPSTWAPIGEPLVTGLQHAQHLAISNDDHRLAYSTLGHINVIDLGSGRPLASFEGEGRWVSINLDGSRVSTGSTSFQFADVWDVDSSAKVAEIKLSGDVAGIFTDFLPNGDLLVGEQGSDTLAEYSLADQAGTIVHEIHSLPGISGLAVSPDGSWIATGGLAGVVVLVESATFEAAAGPIATRGSRISDLFFSPDSRLAAVAGDDGSVSVYYAFHSDPAGPRGSSTSVLSSITGLTGQINGEFIGRDRLVEASLTDGQFMESDVQVSTAIGSTTNHLRGVTGVGLADAEVVTTFGAHVRISPISDPGAELRATDVGDGVEGVAVDASAGLIAIGSFTETPEFHTSIRVLSLSDLSDVAAVDTGSARVSTLSFSPDGETLAVGFLDGRLGVYDPRTGRSIAGPLDVDTVPLVLGTVVWTADGKRLFTGGQDGTLRIFDTTTWTVSGQVTLVPLGYSLRRSTLSPDGRVLLVPSESGDVFVVDAVTGKPMGAPLIAGGTALQAASFTNDMKWIVALSRDGALRLWDATTHRSVGPPMQAHDGYADSLIAYGPELMITGSQNDGHVVVWNLDPATWGPRACELAGRNLTQAEWTLYIGGTYHQTCPQWPSGSV
jgi:WD40 repeat protein